jgi:hypothetical protein
MYSYTRHKKEYAALNKLTLYLNCVTYVPLRTIVLGYTTKNVMMDNYFRQNNIALYSIYSALYAMSVWYSYKLVRTARKRLQESPRL